MFPDLHTDFSRGRSDGLVFLSLSEFSIVRCDPHRQRLWHQQVVNTEIRLIIFFAAKDGEALYSQQKQNWELNGSDHELLIAKFRLKFKKVGKITRPFRYDLNQILYDYTVEVTNRFKGLDLIECLKNYGWKFVTLYRRQGSRPSPRKKRQNGCLMRHYK